MKILLISPTQSGIGGIAQHVQGLTKFLKNDGHQVEIISSENTFTIPIKGLKNPSFMISSFLKAKFKKNFDIIHAHNIPSALAMKNSSGKKILSLHGIYSQQIDQLHGTTTGNISSKYEKNALTWADTITVISKEAYDYYSKLGYEVFQIPNAIDISGLTTKTEKLFNNQILFAGRLSKEKGIDILSQIIEKLPSNINLIIAGKGPDEEKIKYLSQSKNNIHFFGLQSKEKVIALLRGSKILLQPSIHEGISSTILEAMACKTLVIATNVGGNPELIKNNQTGILVEPNNSNEILNKIQQIFDDEEKRIQIINNAYDHVKKYDWEIIGNLYVKLYDYLLKS